MDTSSLSDFDIEEEIAKELAALGPEDDINIDEDEDFATFEVPKHVEIKREEEPPIQQISSAWQDFLQTIQTQTQDDETRLQSIVLNDKELDRELEKAEVHIKTAKTVILVEESSTEHGQQEQQATQALLVKVRHDTEIPKMHDVPNMEPMLSVEDLEDNGNQHIILELSDSEEKAYQERMDLLESNLMEQQEDLNKLVEERQQKLVEDDIRIHKLEKFFQGEAELHGDEYTETESRETVNSGSVEPTLDNYVNPDEMSKLNQEVEALRTELINISDAKRLELKKHADMQKQLDKMDNEKQVLVREITEYDNVLRQFETEEASLRQFLEKDVVAIMEKERAHNNDLLHRFEAKKQSIASENRELETKLAELATQKMEILEETGAQDIEIYELEKQHAHLENDIQKKKELTEQESRVLEKRREMKLEMDKIAEEKAAIARQMTERIKRIADRIRANGESAVAVCNDEGIATLEGLPLENTRALFAMNNALPVLDSSCMTNMLLINVSGNKIVDVKQLGQLNNLRFLDVSRNPLSSIEGIPQSLQILIAHNIPIENLESLPTDQSRLLYLDFSNNIISSLPSILNNLSLLRYLSFASTNITTLPSLSFSLLYELNIENNGIEHLEMTGWLPRLRILRASNNNINLVKSLSACPFLHQLHLANNKISDMESVYNASTCRDLKILDLRDNAIVGNNQLKKNLDLLFPNLEEFSSMKTNSRPRPTLSPAQKINFLKLCLQHFCAQLPTACDQRLQQVFEDIKVFIDENAIENTHDTTLDSILGQSVESGLSQLDMLKMEGDLNNMESRLISQISVPIPELPNEVILAAHIEYTKQRILESAVIMAQSRWRGYVVRKEVLEARLEILKRRRAARVIERAFKSYKVRKEQKRKQELIDSLDDALGVTGELDDLDEWLKANSEEKFDEEMDKYLKSGEFEFIDQRILEAEDVAPHVSTSVPEMKAEEAPNSEYQRVQEDEKVEEEEGWQIHDETTRRLMQKSKGRYAKFANRAKERETQKNPMKRLENFYRHSDSFALDKALENVGHRTNAVNHPPVLYEWDIESVGSVNSTHDDTRPPKVQHQLVFPELPNSRNLVSPSNTTPTPTQGVHGRGGRVQVLVNNFVLSKAKQASNSLLQQYREVGSLLDESRQPKLKLPPINPSRFGNY